MQGGTVKHIFTPEGILSCLKFAGNLKPSANISDALADAAEVLSGADDPVVHDILARDSHEVPSLNLLRMARVRLDIMSILFERRLFMKYRYIRYFLVDSSPQLGRNFLCVREDRVAIPRNDFVTMWFRAQFDINSTFETRICPLSTLGVGNAGLAKKG